MNFGPTRPHRVTAIPVRKLAVEVIAGPDVGRSHTADSDKLTIGRAQGNDLCVSDPTVSSYHVELSPQRRGVWLVDHGSTNGSVVEGIRVERGLIPVGAKLHLGDTVIRVRDGGTGNIDIIEGDSLAGLRGRTPPMRRLMAELQKAASTEVTVLITGESGSGKELIAEAIHSLSPRSEQRFVTVDCASLSPTLVASELFGHERGAFTGAQEQRRGAFELAHGGTLFLDELGELPQPLQAQLLGVLERRRFRRIGGSQEIEVDVRVVSATHRDLRKDVNLGNFRLDLFHRIAVLTLHAPPLRERVDDIPLLIEHFLRDAGHLGAVEEVFSPSTIQTFIKHQWPGNVRELRNVVESVLTLGEETALRATVHATESTVSGSGVLMSVLNLPYADAKATVLAEFESKYLGHLLDKSAGNVAAAARAAKMNRSHLTELLKRYRPKSER